MSILVLGGPWQGIGLVILALAGSCGGVDPSTPELQGPSASSRLIDHTCTDLSLIPLSSISAVGAGVRLHYAHTSHGSQLTTGLERLEESDPAYCVELDHGHLPRQQGALCVFDGQTGETYITPDLFWETPEGLRLTREVLDGNPSINVCMWSWCSQLDYYGFDEVQTYLDAMTELESDYPGVTFVYMTGNAQASGAEGYNRYLRNGEIREHCRDGDRVLFDFADLDSWWHDPSVGRWERSTYMYEGVEVPVEHPEYHGDEAGHTTFQSCEQKGRALWWLLAVTAGWTGE